MRILAIETSCDETAVAIVKDGWQVESNIIASQADLHAITGGVVPEVASREHVRQLPWIYQEALTKAGLTIKDIDTIAATETPGLVGSLLVGIQTARTIASIHNLPYVPVNHIHGHIFSNWLEREPQTIQFPVLSLTVSGGHTNLYYLESANSIELLGGTQDDAAGEAFDKVAKLLDLGYPGGPKIAALAEQGDPNTYDFPVAKLTEPYNFSFSGLKTSVLYKIRDLNFKELDQQTKANIAASFQKTVVDTLIQVIQRAATKYECKQIHIAGGVSANLLLRERLQETFPDVVTMWPKRISYCTDNAAMIAAAAYQKISREI